MDTSDEEDEQQQIAAPLMPRPGIPTAIKDNRKPYQKQLAVYIILTSTLLERIAFYTLAANLSFNIEAQDPASKTTTPTSVSFTFTGLSYFSTFLFAAITDWKLGRMKTIIVGFILYIIGYILAIVIVAPHSIISACLSDDHGTKLYIDECTYWLYPTLVLIALASGAVQSNMPVFGAEQIQESKVTSRYFDKHVIVMNIAGIFGVLVIRTIYDTNQSDHKYFIPMLIALSSLVIAAILFISGWTCYIHVPPYDTVLTNFFPVLINAFQSWRKYKKNQAFIRKRSSSSMRQNTLAAPYDPDDDESMDANEYDRPYSFLDFAKGSYNGQYSDRVVNDVKSLRKALIVFILLIPFWLIYDQLNSTFPLQGRYMKINVTTLENLNHTAIRDRMISLMWLPDPGVVITVILILNLFVYKRFGKRIQPLIITIKFVVGMSFAILSICTAGIVEYYRQKKCSEETKSDHSKLSLYYQIPQYFFMGLGESFGMVASFDYAYFGAPRSAQTLFMSLRFCSLGASSFINIGYMATFAGDTSTLDFHCQHTDKIQWRYPNYFFVLGGIQFLFMIIFIICQKKHNIIKVNPQQTNTKQFIINYR